MKRLLGTFLALGFLLSLAAPAASAMTWPGLGGTPPADPLTITGLNPEQEFPMLCIQPGDSLDNPEFQGQVPTELACMVMDEMGRTLQGWCPVVWDWSAAPATDSPGRISVPGTLCPAGDDQLAEGLSPAVSLPVVVAGERPEGATEPLARVICSALSLVPAPLGISPQEYFATHSTGTTTCYTAVPGEFFLCDVLWDYAAVDSQRAGTYTATGVPKLPAGFALPVDFQPFSRKICVMPDGVVDLSGASYDAESHEFSCRWLYTIAEDIPVRMEYAIGQGPWTQDDHGYLRYSRFVGNTMSVHLSALEPLTDYYFRMVYEEKTSNLLHIRLENKDFLTDSSVPTFDIGGDRDGGDWGGSNLPDLDQPAPFVPSSNPPVQELVTDTSTTISARRLLQLAAGGETMLFEKQGIAVELPSDFVTSLALTDNELFLIRITSPAPNSFALQIFVDEQEQVSLQETTVRLPWSGAQTDLTCVNAEGVCVSDAVYEPQSGTVRCAITAPGSYTICEATSTLQPADVSRETVPPQMPPHGVSSLNTQAPQQRSEPTPPKSASAAQSAPAPQSAPAQQFAPAAQAAQPEHLPAASEDTGTSMVATSSRPRRTSAILPDFPPVPSHSDVPQSLHALILFSALIVVPVIGLGSLLLLRRRNES